MGFNAPNHDQLKEARDAADANHKSYWEANGGSPHPETYFPGFERGWADAVEALSSGNSLPDDLASWAKQRAQESGQAEDAWEWEHGFKAGAEAARAAGEN
ncbi:hypothetical protein IAU59_002649 [Kwoniella sp. CBS 9459]